MIKYYQKPKLHLTVYDYGLQVQLIQGCDWITVWITPESDIRTLSKRVRRIVEACFAAEATQVMFISDGRIWVRYLPSERAQELGDKIVQILKTAPRKGYGQFVGDLGDMLSQNS